MYKCIVLKTINKIYLEKTGSSNQKFTETGLDVFFCLDLFCFTATLLYKVVVKVVFGLRNGFLYCIFFGGNYYILIYSMYSK